MELVTPAPIEHCAPRGESFADTLKATLQETDPAATDSDNAPPTQSDFEAAIALIGALTTPMCAVIPPPESLGLPRPPVAAEEQADISGAQQPGPRPGDQRIPPTVGEIPPPAPPAIGDDIVAPPVPPRPSVPAQPSPIGDALVPVTPLPAPIAPPASAEAAVLPTDLAPDNDLPLDHVDTTAGDPSLSATGGAQKPAVAAENEVAGTAANSGARSQEAVRSTDVPIIDIAKHREHNRSFDLTEDADAFADDAAAGEGTQAIAIAQAGFTDRPTGDSMVKVARSLAQLPSVVSDLAQQSRTESSPRRVVIPLDPPALGHVTVEIIVRADSVKVSLQHGDEATFNALNAQRPAIEAALESNGLHLSGFDVSGNNRQRAPHRRTAVRHFEAPIEQVEPDGALRL
ncbi:MAG: flagellar hook-length control protein FliK [Acidimicrobiales bacterium]